MLSELNKYKNLPPKEFDARLGAILKAQHAKRRAKVPKLVKKAPAKKKTGDK